ncbi:DUF4176 domain-containing protein [Anaerosacchariphilus polymeriproducens]|uniref:DUF4176 domain-containing protein n=1 Tax=Anaerosacchariphilus polymeriproducens TaxID=1812858 RepID=A0A371ASP3_9FIRM|nr:DUF4176 domain-containing protein [Anaerosacchariphilus polymeriproducens]RDU22596.1 DUF4176 domain-containing protein [Anaerosacchariphilus polymeriproducens]
MENNDFEKATLETLIRWLGKKEFINEKTRRNWFEIGVLCKNDLAFLYHIYAQVNTEHKSLKDDKNEILYFYESPNHCIQYKEERMLYTQEELSEILKGMLCILEEILPLGSVVKLKEDFLMDSFLHVKQQNDQQNAERLEKAMKEGLEFVITRRFIETPDQGTYFEYAGVPYPVGQDMQNIILYFTPRMIEEVLHTGYWEEKEKAFVYLIKEELILERGECSIGFLLSES